MNSDSIRIFAWAAPIARDQRLITRARSNLPVPKIVIFEENGVDTSGMDYGKLTPLLVEAVNALRAAKGAEIATLRAEKGREITRLEQRIGDLERLVERIVSTREELKP